jgi:hypothetical protein
MKTNKKGPFRGPRPKGTAQLESNHTRDDCGVSWEGGGSGTEIPTECGSNYAKRNRMFNPKQAKLFFELFAAYGTVLLFKLP